MAVDKTQCIIGPVYISYGGVDLGLTTDDGVTITPEFETTKLQGPQSIGTVASHRPRVNLTAKCTIQQISLTNLQYLMDLSEAASGGSLDLKFQSTVTNRQLVVTGAGPNDGTRTQTYTAGVISCGEIKHTNNEYASMEVEFDIYVDTATGSYGTIVDTAGSATAPAVASYQWINAAGSSETTFTDGATTVADDASALQITFNVAIRPDQLNALRFALKQNDGNTAVACTIAYGSTSGSTDFTKIKLTPTSALSSSTEYELVVMQGILSNDGVASTAAAFVQFTTTA